MQISELAKNWNTTASGTLSKDILSLRLPIEEAAKLDALADMYPKRSREDLLLDLITAALHDLEKSLPYIKGQTVVARDEQGDPIYEDIGLTPEFLRLTKQHLTRLKNDT